MKIENAVVLVTGANRGIGQAFAPILKANGGGALLNVLSIASWVNSGELAEYSASKSAAWSLTGSLW
jgi:short-subunit dehydrogenase